MDEYAQHAFELEYYWGRVEFAPRRGAIHLHILGIAKNEAYLNIFYRAKTEKKKIEVLQSYAEDYLGMTADVQLDETHTRFHLQDRQKTRTDMSPLGICYAECKDSDIDHVHLVQDSMLHACTEYCLGNVDEKGIKLRTCRLGYGSEVTSNKGDTPGKDLGTQATIKKNAKGIEHLLLPRLHSTKVVQHSRAIL